MAGKRNGWSCICCICACRCSRTTHLFIIFVAIRCLPSSLMIYRCSLMAIVWLCNLIRRLTNTIYQRHNVLYQRRQFSSLASYANNGTFLAEEIDKINDLLLLPPLGRMINAVLVVGITESTTIIVITAAATTTRKGLIRAILIMCVRSVWIL